MINKIISDGSRDLSSVYDLGVTYNCEIEGYDFILSKIPPKKVVHMPHGTTERAIVKAKMHHNTG